MSKLYAKHEKCQFISGVTRGLLMDPAKLSAVLQWPYPVGLCAIQRFLGFTNFYRQFMPYFSFLVSPIVMLAKKGAIPRLCPAAAEEASTSLKSAFALAPVLIRPDTEMTFLLEVDASSVGCNAHIEGSQRPNPHVWIFL
ncbi:uncharacterized protein [Engystomops pustulosus]|uniref:uncharacterized protein n=1 Tax=Engystomops pustulosus TaxID=76066 RepID=UPI003AFAD2B9